MSEGDWASKFSEKLEAKQQARLERRRDFGAYQAAVHKLFDWIATKVAGIDAITVQRPMALRTGEFRENVKGAVETIKTMTMRCDGKVLEFQPEGINFAIGKGRIRIAHKIKHLPDYLFLYLVIDPASEEPYPGNLHWTVNDGGEEQKPEEFAPLDDAALESMMESAFLAQE